MTAAPPPAAPSGTRAPPVSIRAGRSRTWSASDLPQLTHLGGRASPSNARVNRPGTSITHAAQNDVPRALYPWQSTFPPRRGHGSTSASVRNPNAASSRSSTSAGPLPSAIQADSCV